MKIETPDDQLIVRLALDQCLGRRSYVVTHCIEWIKKHWDQLCDVTKTEIPEAIQSAYDRNQLGDAMDTADWRLNPKTLRLSQRCARTESGRVQSSFLCAGVVLHRKAARSSGGMTLPWLVVTDRTRTSRRPVRQPTGFPSLPLGRIPQQTSTPASFYARVAQLAEQWGHDPTYAIASAGRYTPYAFSVRSPLRASFFANSGGVM